MSREVPAPRGLKFNETTRTMKQVPESSVATASNAYVPKSDEYDLQSDEDETSSDEERKNATVEEESVVDPVINKFFLLCWVYVHHLHSFGNDFTVQGRVKISICYLRIHILI